MDRSYEFKRVALYWQSVLQKYPDIEDKDHMLQGSGDKFSSVSSILFNRLLALDALTSPYTLVNTSAGTFKNNQQNTFILPNKKNVSNFIRSKRSMFSRIGINHIVHDTKAIGELISQINSTLEAENGEAGGQSSSEEHRRGVVRCLNHVLHIVRNNLQDYERFRLKTEYSLTNCMKTMTENMSEYHIANTVGNNSSTVSGSYISCFIPSLDNSDNSNHGEHVSDEIVCGESDPGSSGISSPIPEVNTRLHSRESNKKNHSRSRYGLNTTEIYDQQISDIMVKQHTTLVNSISDEIQVNELNTINSVQERLTEISSMFEKFTGTLVEQLDLFENINANVIESISNIEKTQESLKKANSDGIPLYHLIMCYSFLGLAALLLFVDYIKSTKGAYFY